MSERPYAGPVPASLARLLADPRVKYLIAGGTVAASYLIIFVALSWGVPKLHYYLAFAIAQVIAISIAFPLYRRYVFASTGSIRGDLPRFISVWAASLCISAAGLPLLVELVGVHPVPAQVLLVVLVAGGSYLGHRFVSFPHRSSHSAGVTSPPTDATSSRGSGTSQQSPPDQ